MPVRVCWNCGVGAPPVVVDSGHHSVIAVFEAYIGRVNLLCRRERLIKQLPALLVPECLRVVGGDRRQQSERGRHRVDQVLRFVKTELLCFRDFVLQGRSDGRGVLVIIVQQDENQYGNTEQNEEPRHHRVQPERAQLMPVPTVEHPSQSAYAAYNEACQQGPSQRPGFHPFQQILMSGEIDHPGRHLRFAHHAKADIGIGDGSPALDGLITNRDETRLDQQFGLVGLEQQRVASFLCGVTP